MFRQQPSKNAQPLKQSTDKLLALMVLSAMKPCADVSVSLDTQQLHQEKQNVPKFLLDNLNGARRLEDVPHVKFHLSMLQLIPTAKSTAVSEIDNLKLYRGSKIEPFFQENQSICNLSCPAGGLFNGKEGKTGTKLTCKCSKKTGKCKWKNTSNKKVTNAKIEAYFCSGGDDSGNDFEITFT